MRKNLPESFKESLWVYYINTGISKNCNAEIMQAFFSKYNTNKMGIKLVSSPRHADILLVSNVVTKQMQDKIKQLYNQMPEPKLVVSIGDFDKGSFDKNDMMMPLDKIISVDANISGSPPNPGKIIDVLTNCVKTDERTEGKK